LIRSSRERKNINVVPGFSHAENSLNTALVSCLSLAVHDYVWYRPSL
jgi:hypothetical protein